MKHELVSVVIPVYGVECFLNRCIDSVIGQSYENIEIILIDDGSPDNCGIICDQFAKVDSRVKVYHRKNEGAAAARNFGVKKSNGTYIVFVDSDDYIAKDYIAYLVSLVDQYGADISCCGMVKTNNDEAVFNQNDSLPETCQMTGREACIRLMDDLYLMLVVPWGKAIKREIAQQYPFPTGKKDEDEATTGKWLYEANRVVIGNKCLYAYYQNPNSLTHTKGESKHLDAIWALEHRARFYEEKNERILAKIAWGKVFLYCMQDSLKNNRRCDEYLNSHVCLKRLNFKVLIHWVIYKLSPSIYGKLAQY